MAETAEKPSPSEETKSPLIDISTPKEDEGGVEASPSADQHAWRQQKESRWAALKREKDEASSKAEEYRRQMDERETKWRDDQQRMAVELAEIKGRMAAQGETKKVDDYETKVSGVEKKVLDAYAAGDYDTARRHERELREIDARRIVEEMAKTQRQNQPDPTQLVIASEFPWVRSNENARKAADGYINILLARGKPDGLETYREACRMAAQDLGISKAPLAPVSDSQRRLYGAVPSRETAPSGGAGIRPTASEVEMAERMNIPIAELMRTRARNDPGRLE